MKPHGRGLNHVNYHRCCFGSSGAALRAACSGVCINEGLKQKKQKKPVNIRYVIKLTNRSCTKTRSPIVKYTHRGFVTSNDRYLPWAGIAFMNNVSSS